MVTRWSVPAGVALAELGRGHGSLQIAVDGPVDQRTTYWDSDDLRLARAGTLLRHVRDSDGGRWQAGRPDPDGGGLREFAGPGNRPPPEAIGQVLAYLRTARPGPRRRVSVRRWEGRVSDGGGTLARLSQEEVSVYEGRRVAERFRELVVQPVEGITAARLEVIGDVLRPLGATAVSNPQHWLRLLGPEASQPADVDVRKLAGGDSKRPLEEIVSTALLVDFDRMLRHDAGTRLGEDPEELHQMRVATRRLRSTLRTFRPLLDREWSDQLRGRLQQLAAALGAVRDLDVQLGQFVSDTGRLDDRDAAALTPLLGHFGKQRARTRGELLDVLASPGYLELLETLLEAGRRPKVLEPTRAAGAALAPLLRKAWRRLRNAVEAGADLHEVRIRAKRLRYVADAARPAFGNAARRLARAAADVQDVLGVYQDAIVTQQLLRGYITTTQPRSEQAAAIGMLLAHADQRKSAALAQWPDAWRTLRRHKLRRFLKS